MSASDIAGILPAIVFPTATAFQLVQIARTRSAVGVSAITWSLFGFANIGMYFYARRYFEWQAIVGTLLTALFDFWIAALAIAARKAKRQKARSAIPAAERIPDHELALK